MNDVSTSSRRFYCLTYVLVEVMTTALNEDNGKKNVHKQKDLTKRAIPLTFFKHVVTFFFFFFLPYSACETAVI